MFKIKAHYVLNNFFFNEKKKYLFYFFKKIIKDTNGSKTKIFLKKKNIMIIRAPSKYKISKKNILNLSANLIFKKKFNFFKKEMSKKEVYSFFFKSLFFLKKNTNCFYRLPKKKNEISFFFFYKVMKNV